MVLLTGAAAAGFTRILFVSWIRLRRNCALREDMMTSLSFAIGHIPSGAGPIRMTLMGNTAASNDELYKMTLTHPETNQYFLE